MSIFGERTQKVKKTFYSNGPSVEGVQVYDFKKNSRQWRVMGLAGRT
jgi:hypothetical protein